MCRLSLALCLLFASGCWTPTHYVCRDVADGIRVCADQLPDGGVP